MIDTVVFRIHDLKKHEGVVKYLHQREFGGQSRFVKDIDIIEKLKPIQDVIDNVPDADKRDYLNRQMKDFEFAAVDARGFIKRSYIHNYWTDFATGRSFEQSYRAHLPSHHYNIAYCIDFSKDFIEFNFSLPKYLYRTNVFQFVDHFFDAHYSPVYHATIERMIEPSYKKFRNFMSWFFDRMLNGHVEMSRVQICRIDLCFNKMFSSKDEALLYLSDLKRVRKKYLKQTKTPSSYHTGIYFAHKDYTFKVYHKGHEFQVHDKSKLSDLAPDKVEEIQKFADRMVRYELECKPGLMNTVFKRKLFRSDSVKWKRAYRYFGQFRRDGSIVSQGKRMYTAPPLADKDGVEHTRKEIKEMTITPEQKKLIRYGKFYYDKIFHFNLDSKSTLAKDSGFWEPEIRTSQFTFHREQKFGLRMYKNLVHQFKFFFDQFSITYQDDLSYRIGKIESMYPDVKMRSRELQNITEEKYGVRVKEIQNISFSKVKVILQLLKEKPLSDLKEILPDRTFRRYKKFLELYGFKDYAPINYVFKSDDTYDTYYRLVDDLNSILRFQNLFKTPF